VRKILNEKMLRLVAEEVLRASVALEACPTTTGACLTITRYFFIDFIRYP